MNKFQQLMALLLSMGLDHKVITKPLKQPSGSLDKIGAAAIFARTSEAVEILRETLKQMCDDFDAQPYWGKSYIVYVTTHEE